MKSQQSRCSTTQKSCACTLIVGHVVGSTQPLLVRSKGRQKRAASESECLAMIYQCVAVVYVCVVVVYDCVAVVYQCVAVV